MSVSLLSQTEPQRFVIILNTSRLTSFLCKICRFSYIGIDQLRYHAYTCTSYFQYMYHQVSHQNGSIGHIYIYICVYIIRIFEYPIRIFEYEFRHSLGIRTKHPTDITPHVHFVIGGQKPPHVFLKADKTSHAH